MHQFLLETSCRRCAAHSIAARPNITSANSAGRWRAAIGGTRRIVGFWMERNAPFSGRIARRNSAGPRKSGLDAVAHRTGSPSDPKNTKGRQESSMNEYVNSLMNDVKAKNPAEPEFHQAVQE